MHVSTLIVTHLKYHLFATCQSNYQCDFVEEKSQLYNHEFFYTPLLLTLIKDVPKVVKENY